MHVDEQALPCVTNLASCLQHQGVACLYGSQEASCHAPDQQLIIHTLHKPLLRCAASELQAERLQLKGCS
jgi:hypothetical protein